MNFDLLHILAIKGMASTDALAAAAGRDAGGELDRLRDDGFATFLERRGVWRITPEGRSHHAELLDNEVPAATRDRLRLAYEDFVPLNRRFKDICTRWQMRGGSPNDHADASYDKALIAELGELHPDAEAVIADLSGAHERFARYRDRLAGALERVLAGEVRALTGVMCDSYHDIWMELHRDLLLCLRIDRAEEEARETAEALR
jgi:hypothetical protein